MTILSNPPVRGKAKRGAGVQSFNKAVVVGLPAHGVVPVAMLPTVLVPLKVQIRNSTADFVEFDKIQLHWNNSTPGQGIGPIRNVTASEAGDPNFVYEMEIPVNLIPPEWVYQVNQLEYEVGDIFAGSGAMSGQPVTVIFDRIIPGGEDPPAVLTFTDEQAHEITEADMVSDQLPVFAQAWYDMREGDILTPWLGTGPLDTDGAYLAPLPEVGPGEDHGRFPVFFERADIVALGNREQYFSYKIEDRAGNVSQRAVVIHANVLLADPPGGLLEPIVPAAVADRLVTESETRPTALDVQIPLYTNPEIGQEIIVVWGGVDMPGVFLDATHVPPSPGTPADPIIVIPLKYEDVAKGGIKVTGLKVSYKVMVGNINAGESPDLTLNVDLTTPGGQPDPDPGTPWHEDLGKLTVQSNTVGTPPNTIPARDYDKDAVITIPRLGAISNLPIWILGDELTVTYKTEELTMVPITGSNEPNDLTVPLLAAVIGRGGPGDISVRYRIERLLAGVMPAQKGTAYSDTTTVVVSSSAEFPNDGNPLRQVDFPEKKLVQGNFYIQRTEGRDGTPIHVPVNYTNVDNTSSIDLRFVGIVGFNNTTGAEIDDTEVIISAQPITDADLNRGYAVIPISAEILLKICNRNSSKTTHSITNAAGPTNAADTYMNIAVQHKDPNWACIFPVPPNEP
ncbi:hypothetical protein NLO98_07750 [Pseudomonas syringae]|nr:hypothetical protein [Pseudomonas syringae]